MLQCIFYYFKSVTLSSNYGEIMMSQKEDKVLGILALPAKVFMIMVGIFGIGMSIYILTLIYNAKNKPIEISKQIAYIKPLMTEVEKSVINGKVPDNLKVTELFEKLQDGTIVASAYKNGVLYLNLMKERKNYYVDDNLIAMKPVITNEVIQWKCFYVQAGKIVGEDPYGCIKTSETAQRKKRAPEEIKIPLRYDLFDDRQVILKMYKKEGKEIPKELIAAIEKERLILKKISEKKDQEKK